MAFSIQANDSRSLAPPLASAVYDPMSWIWSYAIETGISTASSHEPRFTESAT